MKQLAILLCSIGFCLNTYAQIQEDFELNGAANILQSPDNHWETDSIKSISGQYSLHHSYDNSSSGAASISLAFDTIELPSEVCIWEFGLRYEYNPSSSNHWAAYLLADSAAPYLNPDSSCQALIFGVNLSGYDDHLKLWQQTGSTIGTLWDTHFDWEDNHLTNKTIHFRITGSHNQRFLIELDTGNSYFSIDTAFIEPNVSTGNQMGFFYSYTSSQDRKLYIDDISLSHRVSDSIPPQLIAHQIVNDSSIILEFSEKVLFNDSTSISIAQNQAKISKQEDNSIKLIFLSDLPEGITFRLSIKNISDKHHNVLDSCSLDLFYYGKNMPKAGELIINEILFNPRPYSKDFIEFYNASNKILDLSHISLVAYKDSSLILHPIGDTFLLPNRYLILSEDSIDIQEQYIYSEDALFIETDLPSYPDDAGSIILVDSTTNIIEQIDYHKDMHLAIIRDAEGVSLERLSSTSNQWSSANESVGFASPGFQNSIYQQEIAYPNAFSLSQDIISPNGDGHQDILSINYTLGGIDNILNIRIFNPEGYLVKYLANNTYAGQKGNILWDGSSDKRQKLPSGIYVIWIETFNLEGEIQHHKLACAISY